MTVEKYNWDVKCVYCKGDVDIEYIDRTWGFMGENKVFHMECMQMNEGAEVPTLT